MTHYVVKIWRTLYSGEILEGLSFSVTVSRLRERIYMYIKCVETLYSWMKTVSMNKYNVEIVDVNSLNSKFDASSLQSKIQFLDDWNSKKLSECSQSLQSSIKTIFTKKYEIQGQGSAIEKAKNKIIESVSKSNFWWAIKWIYKLVKTFFLWKINIWRLINVWKDINYEWDENDYDYLENAINNIFEPEKRTELTYLLSKIKDNKIKDSLKEQWKDSVSQLYLMLQNCEVWQVMLTNALGRDWDSSTFKLVTQFVSWARWCHALMISWLEKDSNWVVTDLKIIQSTLKWWVHEVSFKKYLSENYSCSDFMLADLPENKKDKVLQNAKNRIWQKYDRFSIITDAVFWIYWSDFNVRKDSAYCSELVFAAMEMAECKLPQPHVAPSDLLLTWDITPKYCCYCDEL